VAIQKPKQWIDSGKSIRYVAASATGSLGGPLNQLGGRLITATVFEKFEGAVEEVLTRIERK